MPISYVSGKQNAKRTSTSSLFFNDRIQLAADVTSRFCTFGRILSSFLFSIKLPFVLTFAPLIYFIITEQRGISTHVPPLFQN